MISLFVKTLSDQSRLLIFWVIGFGLIAILMMLFYPTITESSSDIAQYIESLPPELLSLFGGELTDFSSPAGFLNTQLFL